MGDVEGWHIFVHRAFKLAHESGLAHQVSKLMHEYGDRIAQE
jgi:hypothetical protein